MTNKTINGSIKMLGGKPRKKPKPKKKPKSKPKKKGKGRY